MRRLLANLMLWQKFALLGVLGVILFGVPTILYFNSTERVIAFKRMEIEGVGPVRDLLKSVQLMQQHRGLSAVLLNGDASAASRREAKAVEVDQALAALSVSLAKVKPSDARLGAMLAEQQTAWSKVRDAVGARRLSGPESFAGHSAVIAALFDLNERMRDYFKYSLDPDYDSAQLILASFVAMPALTEDLGRARARGAGLLIKKDIKLEDRMEMVALLEHARERLTTAQRAFGKAVDANPELKAQLGTVFDNANTLGSNVIGLAREQIVLPETLSYSSDDYFKQITVAIDEQFKAIGDVTRGLEARLSQQNQSLRHEQLMVLGGILLLAVIAAWLGVLITRSVTSPMASSVDLARRVAACDLTSNAQVQGRDESAQLLGSFNEMTGSLRGIVGDVRTSIEVIQHASREIATGNADLSSRTESQASSLEETASSMEELTSTVQQNAENAREANALAGSASQLAARGGDVVGSVVQTMSSIKESSNKIVDIISVIDGIAFQTNILALNAAVEAARAGEQGRGFAVVASEVRSLAQRSASAAKEIKQLIVDSVEKVDTGGKLVDEAGATMGEIVTSVRHVADIMSEITMASKEQSTGIAQVNDAITQMEAITQQNAALVEQAAAAAMSLQEQAERLGKAVSVFKMSEADAQAHAHAVAAPMVRPTAAKPATSRTVTQAKPGKALNQPKQPVKLAAPAAEPTTKKSASAADDWEEF